MYSGFQSVTFESFGMPRMLDCNCTNSAMEKNGVMLQIPFYRLGIGTVGWMKFTVISINAKVGREADLIIKYLYTCMCSWEKALC